jgi:hypothetical protein
LSGVADHRGGRGRRGQDDGAGQGSGQVTGLCPSLDYRPASDSAAPGAQGGVRTIFEEKASGTMRDGHIELQKVLSVLGEGDTLVVHPPPPPRPVTAGPRQRGARDRGGRRKPEGAVICAIPRRSRLPDVQTSRGDSTGSLPPIFPRVRGWKKRGSVERVARKRS